MNEVNRFSFHVPEYRGFILPYILQIIVTQDDDGRYHIHTRKVFQGGTKEVFNQDIHSAMDKEAYINWLTNALFNTSYKQADDEQKKWLSSFEPEQLENSS